MEQQQKSKKISQNTFCPSDEILEKLLNSRNLDDLRLGAFYLFEKFSSITETNCFLEKASRNWGIRKDVDHLGQQIGYTLTILVSREYNKQLIIGSYGLWCKSNNTPAQGGRKTIIEYI